MVDKTWSDQMEMTRLHSFGSGTIEVLHVRGMYIKGDGDAENLDLETKIVMEMKLKGHCVVMW